MDKKKRDVLIILSILISSLFIGLIVKSVFGLEDYTSYNDDTSPEASITDSTQITANMDRDIDTYIYKDYGVNYFTDFSHNLDFNVSSASSNGLSIIWQLANVINDGYGIRFDDAEDALQVWVYFQASSGDREIWLVETTGGNRYQVDTGDVWDLLTNYYLTIQKFGTAFGLVVYSDSERTSSLSTLNLTLQSDYSFRYLYAVCSYNSGVGGYIMPMFIKNLDIGIPTTSDTYYLDFISVSQNTTELTNSVNFTALWSTNGTLSSYIFSWNFSGEMVNDTALSFSGVICSIIKDLGDNITMYDNNIQFIIYANSTSGIWNSTGLRNFYLTYEKVDDKVLGIAFIGVVLSSFLIFILIDKKKQRRK